MCVGRVLGLHEGSVSLVNPGKPMSDVLYKPDWYQKDGGLVVLCLIHIQFHPFEIWDLVG